MVQDKALSKVNQFRDTLKTSSKLLAVVWNEDKFIFFGLLITSIIPAVIPFVNIYIYKLIIDYIVLAVQLGLSDFSGLYLLLSFRIITYFIQDANFSAQEYFSKVMRYRIPIKLNDLVLTKISSLDIQYFENSKFKDLLEKVTDSTYWRPQNTVERLFYFLQSLTQVVIALLAVLSLNWWLIIPITLISVPEFFIKAQESKISWGIWSDFSPERKKFFYLKHLLQDARSIKEIKIFRLANEFLHELRKTQEDFYKENKSVIGKFFRLNLGSSIFSSLVFIGIEVYVIFQALNKTLTIGDIGFYTGAVNNYQNGLSGLFRSANVVFEDSLYISSIFELLEVSPLIPQSENPVKLNLSKPPKIEFRNVSFTYPDADKKALDRFSLTINPGEKIAFVGENGAGKTTLIKLLARFYDPQDGEILIGGINLKKIDLPNWYSSLGVLFQDFNKYDHTALDNIRFGRVEEEDEKQIKVSAKLAGADKFIEELEGKYHQMLGKTFDNGTELSTGQWQKVALARAFYRNSPILILDEPTASIDARSEAEIFDRVKDLSKDKTVVTISHRFSTVRNTDKIYVINEGKIVEAGSHDELMKQEGEYASLFRLQAKGYQ